MILREIECLKGPTFLGGGEMTFFCFTECPKCHIENSICQVFLIGLDLFCSFLWSIDLKKKGWKISLFVLYLVTYPCVFMCFFSAQNVVLVNMLLYMVVVLRTIGAENMMVGKLNLVL